MNQMTDPCLATPPPSFTPKQGQYLAFIYACSDVRPQKPTCSATSASHRRPYIRWC